MRKKQKETIERRKLLTFSATNNELAQGLLQDQAVIQGLSESRLIENTIIDMFLPRNEHIRNYIRMLYVEGSQQTVQQLFQFLAGRKPQEITTTAAKHLIEYSLQMVSQTPPGLLSGNELDYKQFSTQRQYVSDLLKKQSPSLSAEDQREIEIIELEFKQEKKDFIPFTYYAPVLRFWNELKDYSCTFEMLAAVTGLADSEIWMQHCIAERRKELIDIIIATIEGEQ